MLASSAIPPYTKPVFSTVETSYGRVEAIRVPRGLDIIVLNGIQTHLDLLSARQQTVALYLEKPSTHKPLRLGVPQGPFVMLNPSVMTNWLFVMERLARTFPHVTTVTADIDGVQQEITLFRREPEPHTE
jgi:hypothetical protein